MRQFLKEEDIAGTTMLQNGRTVNFAESEWADKWNLTEVVLGIRMFTRHPIPLQDARGRTLYPFLDSTTGGVVFLATPQESPQIGQEQVLKALQDQIEMRQRYLKYGTAGPVAIEATQEAKVKLQIALNLIRDVPWYTPEEMENDLENSGFTE